MFILELKNCINHILQRNNCSYDTISLSINIDGLLLFKSTALDLRPILILFAKFYMRLLHFTVGKKATSYLVFI